MGMTNQMTKQFTQASKGITHSKYRRYSLLTMYDDIEFGLTKSDRCKQMCWHIPFLIVESYVCWASFEAWDYVHDLENDGNDSTSLSITHPRIYKNFILWIDTYGLLYAGYVFRRLYHIILWTFKDPRTAKAR